MRLAFIVTSQVVPVLLSHPAQLTSAEPASGEAVSVTALPEASNALQVSPQLMPPPVTVPDPVPAFCTVSLYTCPGGMPP